MNPAPGSTIGPYVIDREVGRGGMGIVYRATDTRLDRIVAIKALPEEVARIPDRLERFEREARTLASLNHPNIAQLYGLEEDGRERSLILEYVEGETLQERLARGGMHWQVMENAAFPIVTESGVLFFTRDATLFSAPFDLGSGRVVGNTSFALESVRAWEWGSAAHLDIFWNGTCAYLPGTRTGTARRLVRVTRDGEAEPAPWEQDESVIRVIVHFDKDLGSTR